MTVDGGVDVVPVEERGVGRLFDVRSGCEVDLVSVVVVVGLPELVG